MTIAQLKERITQHHEGSADDLADTVYISVKQAIQNGQRREDLYRMLKDLYADLKARGLKRQRRAVGEVIRCFDGCCAPSAAL